MIYASGAAGPPGYGGVSEGAVGEQELPGRHAPGYEVEPAHESEGGTPPSELDRAVGGDVLGEQPIGVPVDLTE